MLEEVLIIGAGGHARSVMDIILQQDDYHIFGCIDAIYPQKRVVPRMEDIPIVGNDSMINQFFNQGINKAFVALGDNDLRTKISKQLIDIGFELINVISNKAIISPRAHLECGICVLPGAVINVNTQVGDFSIINTNCSIDHDCVIGRGCHIAPGVAISGYVTIGDGTQIGTGASVIDKMKIGAYSFIGGGAVVVSNIAEHSLAVGVPAKIIKHI